MNAEVPGLNLPQGQTPRRKRRWLRALCVVAALLVLVGLLAPYFLNADRFRVSLANLIAAQTGREVMLGKMRVRLLPGVGFAVDNFHMGNPADFAKGEFVSSGEVHGSLAFWPLVLRQEYRITSLELVKPKLALLEDKNGRNNYTFEPSESPPAIHQASFAAIEPNAPAEPSALQVDELTLRDAEVIYGVVDNQGRTTPIVDAAGLNAVLLHLELQPLRVAAWQAAARLAGTRLTLAGWKGPIDFREGDISLRNDALEAAFTVDFGNAAAVEGTLTVPDVEHAVVKFDLKTSDLGPCHARRSVCKWRAATPIPPTATRATSCPRGISSSAGTSVHGAISRRTRVGCEPTFGRGTSQRRADSLGALRRLARLPRTCACIPTAWRFGPLRIRLYGGSLQVSARTDRRQTPQRFSTNMEARNLNLGEMVDTSPRREGTFAGTGELDLQLFGSLDDDLEEVALRPRRIRGAQRAHPRLQSCRARRSPWRDFFGIGGDTTFTAITGDVNVRNQRVASRDIHLNSPRDTADLAGSLGFDGSLDFDGQLIAQIDVSRNLSPRRYRRHAQATLRSALPAIPWAACSLATAESSRCRLRLRGTLASRSSVRGTQCRTFLPPTQPIRNRMLFHKSFSTGQRRVMRRGPCRKNSSVCLLARTMRVRSSCPANGRQGAAAVVFEDERGRRTPAASSRPAKSSTAS